MQYSISAAATGITLLKKNALIASLLVIGKTSFRNFIILNSESRAQQLSKNICEQSVNLIPTHAAAVAPAPSEQTVTHPHSA